MHQEIYIDLELASLLLSLCCHNSTRYDGTVAYNKDGLVDITEEVSDLIEEMEDQRDFSIHDKDAVFKGVPVEMLNILQYSDYVHIHKDGIILITNEV